MNEQEIVSKIAAFILDLQKHKGENLDIEFKAVFVGNMKVRDGVIQGKAEGTGCKFEEKESEINTMPRFKI